MQKIVSALMIVMYGYGVAPKVKKMFNQNKLLNKFMVLVLMSSINISVGHTKPESLTYVVLDADIRVTDLIKETSLPIEKISELNPSLSIKTDTLLPKGSKVAVPATIKFTNQPSSFHYDSVPTTKEKMIDTNFNTVETDGETSAFAELAASGDLSLEGFSKMGEVSPSKLTSAPNESTQHNGIKTAVNENSPVINNDKVNPAAQFDLPALGGESDTIQPTQTDAKSIETTTATLASKSAQYNWNEMSGDELKNEAQNWAKNQVRAVAESEIVQPVNKLVQESLNIFGKAEVNISVNDDGEVKLSRFSLLTPFFEQNSGLAFTQINFTEQNSDLLGHVGLGYRYINNGWLYGVNTFLDHNLDDYHTRMSIGTELGTNYFKGSANYYLPLSSWRDSKSFMDFEERPATGYDVRLQGYLPYYSHIGASAVFEQYLGDDVALFGDDSHRKNPIALTLGLDYTPIPLITAKGGYKFGESGDGEARFDLSLNVLIGEDLSSQLDPNYVSTSKKLEFSRYDIVDRNYEMVLERRAKSEQFEVTLAQVSTLLPQTRYSLNLTYQNNLHPFSHVTRWEQSGGCGSSSLVIENTNGNTSLSHWEIYAPIWQNNPTCNAYRIRAIVADSEGHEKASNEITVSVGAPLINSRLDITTNIQPNNGQISLLADGQDSFEMQVKLIDANGEVLKFDSLQSMVAALGLQGNETYIDLLDSNNISRKNDANVQYTEQYNQGVYTFKISSSVLINQALLKFNGGIFGNSEFNLNFSTGHIKIENLQTSPVLVELAYSLWNPRGEKLLHEQRIPTHIWQILNISGVDIADQLSIIENMDPVTGNIQAKIDLTQLPNAFSIPKLQHLILKTSLVPYGEIDESVNIDNGISYEAVKLTVNNSTPISGRSDYAYAGNGQAITLYGQVTDEQGNVLSVSEKMREKWQWSLYELNASGLPSVEELHTDPRLEILNERYDEAQQRFEITLKATQFINIELFLTVNDTLNSEVLPIRFLRDPSKLSVQLFNTGADGLQPPTNFLIPKIDQYYEVKVFDSTTTNKVDVTMYYVKSLKWYYQDSDDSSVQLINRCDGTHMFSTQVSNTENIDRRSIATNSEQGLMLSAAFDNELDEVFPQPLVKCPDGKYVF